MSEGIKDTASKGEVKERSRGTPRRDKQERCLGRAEAEPSELAVNGREGGEKGLVWSWGTEATRLTCSHPQAKEHRGQGGGGKGQGNQPQEFTGQS